MLETDEQLRDPMFSKPNIEHLSETYNHRKVGLGSSVWDRIECFHAAQLENPRILA